MKKKFLFIILVFVFNIQVASSEIQDCNKYEKLSKDYLKCQKNNLVLKTEDSGITDGVKNFKSSKTLSEFLKKNKNWYVFWKKIKELKIVLPEAKAPVGSYIATKKVGNLLFISGQISINSNGELIKGKIGKDLSLEDGYNAAKNCGLSIISQVKKACDNDLSKVKSCIKLTGFVNSTDDFIDQPKIINGASDLIASVFGEAGMHTRAAVSTNSLPLGVAVEVDAIFELN